MNKKDDISVLQEYAPRESEIELMIEEINGKEKEEQGVRKGVNFNLMEQNLEVITKELKSILLTTDVEQD